MTISLLDAYVSHVARADIDKHPVVWARHTDIWNTPRGELGIPKTVTNPKIASYAVLSPWILCPEIATVELVYDMADTRQLSTVTLETSSDGTNMRPRRVDYQITDRGQWIFSEPVIKGPPDEIRASVTSAVMARMFQVSWEDDIDYDRALDVAMELATGYK